MRELGRQLCEHVQCACCEISLVYYPFECTDRMYYTACERLIRAQTGPTARLHFVVYKTFCGFKSVCLSEKMRKAARIPFMETKTHLVCLSEKLTSILFRPPPGMPVRKYDRHTARTHAHRADRGKAGARARHARQAPIPASWAVSDAGQSC